MARYITDQEAIARQRERLAQIKEEKEREERERRRKLREQALADNQRKLKAMGLARQWNSLPNN